MTNVVQYPIPDGYPGTVETIRRMHELTAAGVQDDRIIRLARDIVYGLPWKNYGGEAAAVLRWCQTNLRYVRDPYHPKGLERLQHPAVTIFETRSEDCDGLSVAYAALCGAIGFPWAFRTIGSDPLFPLRFKHVLALTLIGDQWMPADPSFQEAPLGWEPPDDDPTQSPGAVRTAHVTSRHDWPYLG